MFTLDDVDAVARALPDVTVGISWGHKTWMVGKKGFVWERPFTKADLKRFGDATIPQGEILGVRVESLDAKDALLAIAPAGVFTIEHCNGYPGVLIELRLARPADVRRIVTDAWRAVAPPALHAKLAATSTKKTKPKKPRTTKKTARKKRSKAGTTT